jgi:hypothetical protein
MCRYAEYGPYKEHYACFTCRKMFRRPAACGLVHRPTEGQEVVAPCPQCSEPMRNLGKDFKAPKRTDEGQWRKVALLFQHGYAYHSCGCSGPGWRPATLREAEVLIERLRDEPERERSQRLLLAVVNQRAKRQQSRSQRRIRLALRRATAPRCPPKCSGW